MMWIDYVTRKGGSGHANIEDCVDTLTRKLELVYYDVAVQHVNRYAMGTTPPRLEEYTNKSKERLITAANNNINKENE